MKRLGVFMLPPGWDASPLQGYPPHYAGTHLYTWVERSTVRVKCLAQEHNTMSPARTRTRTTRSRVEHTDHEATVPPTYKMPPYKIFFLIVSNSNPCVLCLNGFRRPQCLQAIFFSLFKRDSPFLVNEISRSILCLFF